MDGSPNNNEIHNYIMCEWYRLFTEQNNIHSDQRYKHWKNVEKCGLPHLKDEKWKHIPLNNLFSYIFVNSSFNNNINESQRDSLSLNIPAYRLVFINGFFSEKLSTKNIQPWKIKIFNRHTHQILPKPIRSEIFLYLTECLNHETIHIILPHNTTSKIPLYLLHINQGISQKKILTTIHYRHHIEIQNNSSGEIIEHYTSINNNTHFTGSFTSIVMKSDTQVKHTKLSFENRKSFHTSYHDMHLNFNSIIQSNIFNIFNNHLNHHQTSALLNNKFSSLNLNSLSLPIERDTSSISTYVEHNTPGYNLSKQMHKIISSNKGTGVFHGIIKVNKKAIKVDGKMINKNLLLHPFSKVFSMPQLEIYADDITCCHGATTGYIDHEQIFYLCSRGIPYQDSHRMIVYAFAYEIIEVINDTQIRQTIANRITSILTRTFCSDISYKENSI